MGALTTSLRRLVMMMGFGVDLPALTAFHDHAMRVMMGDVNHKLGLARAASIGFVAAAFANGRSGSVLKHIGTGCGFRRNQDHVELGHRVGLARKGINLIAHTAQRAPKCQSLIMTGCAV
nr:hypothetical protein [Hyphomonas chukchiensis]